MTELRLMPLYELLEELFNLFELHRIKQQDAYLFAFFDAVTIIFKATLQIRTALFRYWDETLSGKTIPSGEVEGIRIFSIHKSKGLEFHTVLLPPSATGKWKMKQIINSFGAYPKSLLSTS